MKFSKIALDLNHEQLNEEIKGFGRAIELTENYAALQRWLITVADIARFPEEF